MGEIVIRMGASWGHGAIVSPAGTASASREALSAYRVAGHPLFCDRPLTELEPFRSTESTAGQTPEPPPEPLPEPVTAPRTIFHGRGWVCGGLLEVECSEDEAGYHLKVEDAGALRISPGGRRIDRLPDIERGETGPHEVKPRDAAHEVQVLLGPALCLALALQDTFCLHASAVEVGGVSVALVGESGAGKSTLARRLGRPPGPGWRRAADDLLPVASSRRKWVIRPRFPQLKLPAGEQWGRDRPEEVPLAALYLLSLGGPESPLQVDRLSERDAALEVVRHTVAARLFGSELQSRHFDFCLDLVSSLPVRRLRLPRGPDLPPRLVETIRDDRRDALRALRCDGSD